MTILASDAGIPSLSSEAVVVIRILDSNDHAPAVSLTPCVTDENTDDGFGRINSHFDRLY